MCSDIAESVVRPVVTWTSVVLVFVGASSCSFDSTGRASHSLSDASSGAFMDGGSDSGTSNNKPPEVPDNKPKEPVGAPDFGHGPPGPDDGDKPPLIDVMFVIDDSAGMSSEQHRLTAQFARFVSTLTSRFGELPDMHIGIVSTDMGVGREAGDCDRHGKSGVLQSEPTGQECEPIRGAFLRNARASDGIRATNYSGTLVDAFSCISHIGEAGCPFTQPLAAMKAALQSEHNRGFVRDDGFLVVIFVTNKDDCSTSDLDTLLSSGNGSGFRCFEHGVRCAAGTQADFVDDCVPRGRDAVMDIGTYEKLLRTMKPNGDFVVAGLYGDPSPVFIAKNEEEQLVLGSSCDGPHGSAQPAIRLDAFREAVSGGIVRTSICADKRDALVPVADHIAAHHGF